MTWDQTSQNDLPDTNPSGLVRSAVLAGPCAAFSSNGGDVSALLVNSGLSTQQIVDPESILHTHEYLDALARIGHASDDELLFHAGASTPLEDFGLAGSPNSDQHDCQT